MRDPEAIRCRLLTETKICVYLMLLFVPLLELYQSEGCPHCAKVRQTLSELGISYVNYPALFGLMASLRTGLPVSKTRFAGTESVPVGSAVSAGIESE